jgi:hypothetical protein
MNHQALLQQSEGFRHLQSAHCESGVAASLAHYHGIELSEPMAFGIGSGLFFAHFPFIKVMGLPLTTFRSYPGTILKKTFRRTGIPLDKRKFRRQEQAFQQLNLLLEQGIPAGVQLNVYWLPYLPEQFRFQFNAHHAIVCGRSGDQYIISDPMGEQTVSCPQEDFERAWFARGPLAPKGTLYSTEPGQLRLTDLRPAIERGIRDNCNRMLRSPLPQTGIKGIRYLAKQLVRWPEKLGDERRIKLNLGQVIRMQEEVGTGGAGFRFLYAAFLQEAANRLAVDYLQDAATLISAAGDGWRQFAVCAARACKGDLDQKSMTEMAAILDDCASLEERAFRLIDRNLRQGASVLR